jgi:heterodisulfide reductase subunit C
MNTATASNMPASQLRRKPKRLIQRNHKGTDTAAAKKYAPRNWLCEDAGNCKRSCTKNNINVAGMADAMPLSMNTDNKRPKPA